MQATYPRSWLWFLVAIVMVPLAYGQMRQFWGAFFMNGNTGRRIMKLRFLVWMMVLGLMSVPSVKAADTLQIVVGEPGPGQPGNSNLFYPFGSRISLRYQQVYDSSAFGSIPLEIVALSFRVDDLGGGAFSSVIPDIQINLSTTPLAVDGLGSSFALNVGPDQTIVFNRGRLALSSAGTGLFDITINLDTPFFYDPARVNLSYGRHNLWWTFYNTV